MLKNLKVLKSAVQRSCLNSVSAYSSGKCLNPVVRMEAEDQPRTDA